MKTLMKDFPESSLALETILRMFHKWPQKREISLALVHHSSQDCVGSQKLMDTSCPFSLSSLLLFAYFSPKISLGHAHPLPCQHPRTRRKFHTYTHKNYNKYAMPILNARQLPSAASNSTLTQPFISSASAQNPIHMLELVLSFGRNF